MRYIIYGLVDPRTNEVRYIGQSTSGLRRAKAHTFPTYLKVDTPRTLWIRELLTVGLEPEIRVFESLQAPRLLNPAERLWIACAKEAGWPLTNTTNGGPGMRGYRPPAKQRAATAAANRRRIWTKEAREKLAETRRKNAGFAWPPERRAKTSAAKKGIAPAIGEKGFQKMAEIKKAKFGKPFKDQRGNVYRSLKEAADKLGLNRSGISQVLNGHAKQQKGYVFTYL